MRISNPWINEIKVIPNSFVNYTISPYMSNIYIHILYAYLWFKKNPEPKNAGFPPFENDAPLQFNRSSTTGQVDLTGPQTAAGLWLQVIELLQSFGSWAPMRGQQGLDNIYCLYINRPGRKCCPGKCVLTAEGQGFVRFSVSSIWADA